MAGYTRQAAANIATGSVIDADDFNDEYNQIQSAFNASTGHTHDGTAAEGAPIEKVGPSQDLVVTASQVRPKTTNTLDLGTSALQYKDAFFDGTVKTDTLTVDENATITGNLSVAGNLTGAGVNAGARGALSAGTGISYNSSSGVITCTVDTPAEVGLGNLSNNGNNLSGNFTATGNVTAFSDERLKENVQTIEGALDKVSQMRGVTYNYKSELNDGQRGTGVIAQEMQQVMPEVVEEGQYLSVAYGNLVGVLIEAVKELQAEIKELKNGPTK
jgi:ethanolamine utilization protein EutQ (cupin superfamily)